MGPTNRSTEPLDRLGALSHAEGLATEPALDLSVPHSLSAPVCCHATCLRATHRQAADRCDLPTAPCLRADTHRQAAGQTGAQAGGAERTGDLPTPDPPCLPAGGCSYRRGRWTGPPPRPRSRAARGPVPFGHRLPRAPHVGSASRLRYNPYGLQATCLRLPVASATQTGAARTGRAVQFNAFDPAGVGSRRATHRLLGDKHHSANASGRSRPHLGTASSRACRARTPKGPARRRDCDDP